MVNEEIKQEATQAQTETETKTAPASAPEQQQAKEDISNRADLLDKVVEQGKEIETETKGENPDWKGVKEVFVGEPPINKAVEASKVEPKAEVKVETQVEKPKIEEPTKTVEIPKEIKEPVFVEDGKSTLRDWIKESNNSRQT